MTAWCDRTLIKGDFVGLALTEKSFHKSLKQLGIPRKEWPKPWVSAGSDATCHHLKASGGARAHIVCMIGWEKTKKSQVYGLLAHEAVHLKQEFMRSINEHEPSAEFEAYVVQNLTQGLWSAFKLEKK